MCVEFKLSSSSSFWGIRGPKFTLAGACGPRARPLAEVYSYLKEYLDPSKCVENLDFLPLVVPEIWGGSKFTLRGRCAPRTPSAKKSARGLIQMCVKFQLSISSSFRDMRGSQIYTRGGAPPAPLAEKNHFWKVHLADSKCVWHFKFLAVVISETWEGSQITLGALRPMHAPSGKIFKREKSTWPYLNVCKMSTIYL